MLNIQNIASKLASMPDAALKQYAEMHKDDPYTFSLALSESNRRKQMRSQAPQAEPQPKVVDQELENMKMLPEDTGIARIPIDMNMASGGIVAFNDGGMSHYDKGGTIRNAGEGFSSEEDSDAFKFALNNTLSLEGGLNKNDKVGGLTKYGISQKAYPKLDIAKLTPANAKEIYKRDYWEKIGGDELAARDPKLAALVFDTAVQHGVQGAKDMLSQSGDDTAKLLEIRSDKLKSLVETQPEKYGSQAKGWSNRIAKLAYTLAPGATAQAATPTEVAPPQEADRSVTGQLKTIGQGIAGIGRRVGDVVAPEGDGRYAPGTRNFFERAADQLGVGEETQRNVSNTLNALPGVNMLRAPVAVGKLSTASKTAIEAEKLAAAQKAAAAAAAQAKVANLRLPSTPAQQGIASIPRPAAAPPAAPRTTYPLSPEAIEMNAKVQASRQAQAVRNLEADKIAAQAAGKGATEAADAAKTLEAIKMANAAKAANNVNRVTQPINKAVDAARVIQSSRIGPTESPMNSEVSPTEDRTSQETQSLLDRYPKPAIDDRTKRDPANYKPEEKKEIIAAAKEAVPKSEDTDGWSGNDWLQFGLSLMAGQSPYALSNIGAAGLGVLASKAEKKKEQSKLDMYKTIHADKPGQSIQIAERLMAADPKLSFEAALARGAELTGGSTKQDLADIKAEQAKASNLKNFEFAKDKLDTRYQPYLAGTGPSAQAAQTRYEAELQKLYERFGISEENVASPTANVIPGAKIVGTR
jgi:lysozyme family protein